MAKGARIKDFYNANQSKLKFEDLIEWYYSDHLITYASHGNKSLSVSFHGQCVIKVNGKIVLKTENKLDAIKFYNDN